MKTNYLLLINLCIASFCFSQNNPDVYKSKNFIVWGKEELKWKDFRGPILSPDYEAGTYGGFSYYKEKSGKLYWFAYFSKDKSWHTGETDYCLEHEKYHFNVVEIHARKLRKVIIEKKLSMNNTKKMNEYINSIWAECEAMQNAYDNETEHSKNEKKQNEWERKIDYGLNELKSYSKIAIN